MDCVCVWVFVRKEPSALMIVCSDLDQGLAVLAIHRYSCTPLNRSKYLPNVTGMFDRIVAKNGLEKIGTAFGARYIAVSGLPLVRDDHAGAAAECALTMVKTARDPDLVAA